MLKRRKKALCFLLIGGCFIGLMIYGLPYVTPRPFIYPPVVSHSKALEMQRKWAKRKPNKYRIVALHTPSMGSPGTITDSVVSGSDTRRFTRLHNFGRTTEESPSGSRRVKLYLPETVLGGIVSATKGTGWLARRREQYRVAFDKEYKVLPNVKTTLVPI